MSIFKKLGNLFSAPQASPFYTVTVKCNRCGEIIQANINLNNDLSQEYVDDALTYFCRKTLMGEAQCFQRVEVELTFDKNKRLINREIIGGQFVED